MNGKGWRRGLAVVAVVLAAVVATGGGLAGSVRSAATQSSYVDPTGDAGGAPDIGEVVVSNDGSGLITMRIGVPDRPQLGIDDAIGLWIDADRNELTGRYGAEFRLLKFSFGAVFERWINGDWNPHSPPSLVVRWETGVLVVAVKAADVGVADAFDFYTGSVNFVGDDPGSWPFDDAPDFGAWTYRLVFPPKAGSATMRPSPPKAGSLVTVTVPVTLNGRPADGGTVKCVATFGGKPLAAQAAGLNRGVAGCAWRVPRTVGGTTLRGSVAITTAGGTATRAFSARVR